MDPFGLTESTTATAESDPKSPDGMNVVEAAAEAAKTRIGQSEVSASEKHDKWFEENMKGTSAVGDDVDLDDLAPPKAEKGEEVAGTESTEDPATTSESTIDTESDEFKRAVQALKRLDIPDSTLEEMLKNNPETVLEWGGSQANAQSETDGFGRELDKLKQQIEEKDPATKKDTVSPEDSEPFDPAKSDARLAEAAEPLSSILGLENNAVAPALGQYGHALTKEIISAVVPLFKSQSKEIEQLQGLVRGMQISEIRSGLASKYGEAATKKWSDIEAETEGMRFKKGETDTEFYSRAARAVLGDPPAKKKPQVDTTTMRNNGTASASSDRSRDNGGRFSKTPNHGDDPDIVWMAARDKGKSIPEANLIAWGNREGRRNTG